MRALKQEARKVSRNKSQRTTVAGKAVFVGQSVTPYVDRSSLHLLTMGKHKDARAVKQTSRHLLDIRRVSFTHEYPVHHKCSVTVMAGFVEEWEEEVEVVRREEVGEEREKVLWVFM